MRILAVALALLQVQEAPPHDPVVDGLRYLLIHQGPDGSWGARPARCYCEQKSEVRLEGDLEATAWAILAFAGAGYTELSKDDWEGRRPGLSMKAALAWLLARQDRDGAFDRKDVSANAVAALALLEIHGMTVLHKEASQKAFDWVRRCKATDDLGRIRLGMALKSAEFADFLPAGSAELRGLATSLEAGPGDTARIGRLLVRNFAETAKERRRAKIVDGTLEVARLTPELLNVLTNATHGGKEWPEWYRGVREQLAALQHRGEGSCQAGSWDGATLRERVSNTAIRCLTAEHYRCFVCRGSVFGQ